MNGLGRGQLPGLDLDFLGGWSTARKFFKCVPLLDGSLARTWLNLISVDSCGLRLFRVEGGTWGLLRRRLPGCGRPTFLKKLGEGLSGLDVILKQGED